MRDGLIKKSPPNGDKVDRAGRLTRQSPLNGDR